MLEGSLMEVFPEHLAHQRAVRRGPCGIRCGTWNEMFEDPVTQWRGGAVHARAVINRKGWIGFTRAGKS